MRISLKKSLIRARLLPTLFATVAAAVLALLAFASAAWAGSPPVATTRSATEVKRATAIINGYVEEGGEISYYYEYGRGVCNVAAKTCVSTPTRGPIQGEGEAEAVKLTRLKPGTTYDYRLVAIDADGISYGQEKTFTTASAEPEEYVFEKTLEGFTFVKPFGLGLNQETGDVYVVDRNGTHPIVQYDAGGELQSSTTMPVGSGTPGQIAVDNSCAEHSPKLTGSACTAFDPSNGDVYIADKEDGVAYKFDPNAKGELAPDPTTPKIPSTGTVEEPGLAVDSSGNVYLSNSSAGTVSKFSPTGALVQENLIEGLSSPFAIAVDGAGNIYVAGPSGTFEYSSIGACSEACQPINAESGKGVAVDSAGDVFVSSEEHGPQEYAATPGRPRIANPELERLTPEARGLAVNNSTHVLYDADLSTDTVKAFSLFKALPATVKTEPATAVSGTVEALNGTVNPGGVQPAEYYFEYGTARCMAETCGTVVSEQSETPLRGAAAIPVAVRVAGLAPETTYHYWVVAVNEASGIEHGAEQTFTTGPAPASVAGEEGPEAMAPSGVEPEPLLPYPVLAALAPVPAPKAPQSLTRPERLGKALRACRKDKRAKKKQTCERSAHRRFGAVEKKGS